MPFLHQILATLDAVFPFARAESWDKVGLQVGDQNATVGSITVAYDITPQVLAEAAGTDCLVCYHPLIFRPLEKMDFRDPTARLVGTLLAAGQHLIAVHTALDAAPAPNALGDALARDLGLADVQVLPPVKCPGLVKVVTFVPSDRQQMVAEAMWQAGAGAIGLYDEASFSTPGQGTFRPMPGAEPYLGQVGEREIAQEVRLEMLVPDSRWRPVVEAMKRAHPYQEVAYDVIPLLNVDQAAAFGSGRIGMVPPQGLEEYCGHVMAAVGQAGARLVRGSKEIVSTVACSPGSGAGAIEAAVRAGADLLVTGDIKHHDALKAAALGLAVLDITHAATELGAVPLMASVLETMDGVQVTTSSVEVNPFQVLRKTH